MKVECLLLGGGGCLHPLRVAGDVSEAGPISDGKARPKT